MLVNNFFCKKLFSLGKNTIFVKNIAQSHRLGSTHYLDLYRNI